MKTHVCEVLGTRRKGGDRIDRTEINEILGKQMRLLSERSEKADDMSLAALTEQMVPLSKALAELEWRTRPIPPHVP